MKNAAGAKTAVPSRGERTGHWCGPQHGSSGLLLTPSPRRSPVAAWTLPLDSTPLASDFTNDGRKPAKTALVLPGSFVTAKCLIPRGRRWSDQMDHFRRNSTGGQRAALNSVVWDSDDLRTDLSKCESMTFNALKSIGFRRTHEAFRDSWNSSPLGNLLLPVR